MAPMQVEEDHGGGSINIFYRNNIEQGNIEAQGGKGGGNGGNGSITTTNITWENPYYVLNKLQYTNQDMKIKITSTSKEKVIQKVTAPEGVTKEENGWFKVSVNGEYKFKIQYENGEQEEITVPVTKIDKLPPKQVEPKIAEVNELGTKITIQTQDQEQTTQYVKSGINRYELYVDGRKYTNADGIFRIAGWEENIAVYGIIYDKAGNTTQTEVKTITLPSSSNARKTIYIDQQIGDDNQGEGTRQKPYASLEKITQQGIIEKGKDYQIELGEGEYTLTTALFNLNCDKEIKIVGQEENTKLIVGEIFSNRGGGSKEYSISFYQLVWNGVSNEYNTIDTHTSMNFYNVAFDILDNEYSYFLPASGANYQLFNCTLGKKVQNVLRTTNGSIRLTNCYGGYSSGWGTRDEQWNYQTNYITDNPQVNERYEITEAEELWKGVGTGTNPDGTQANLGVYGGMYSW